jgi:hypothetical protein
VPGVYYCMMQATDTVFIPYWFNKEKRSRAVGDFEEALIEALGAGFENDRLWKLLGDTPDKDPNIDRIKSILAYPLGFLGGAPLQIIIDKIALLNQDSLTEQQLLSHLKDVHKIVSLAWLIAYKMERRILSI